MPLGYIIELSMTLSSSQFQKMFERIDVKSKDVHKDGNRYIDTSLSEKGITVVYRNTQYKKKIMLSINPYMVTDRVLDSGKIIRKLNKRISEYFDGIYKVDDFYVSSAILVTDLRIGSKNNADAYIPVLKRISRVKGFSPTTFKDLNEETSFCLSGNSNDIDFLIYNLDNLLADDVSKSDRKELSGFLRSEVRLMKPKAIRQYIDTDNTSSQIAYIIDNGVAIFMDTFERVIPFGWFYKKSRVIAEIHVRIKDTNMVKKMIKLVELIPEKKSLWLAQKALTNRNIDEIMEAFESIDVSPVTISKRQGVTELRNLYLYLDWIREYI